MFNCVRLCSIAFEWQIFFVSSITERSIDYVRFFAIGV